MSWVYWGIVTGLVAMVATVFISFAILKPNAKGSPNVPNGEMDEPREASTHASTDHRRAA